MARRIVLTMFTLAGVLIITMVPLGLITTGHERGFFRSDTFFSAGTLASFSEDRIADHAGSPALTRMLAQARRLGEQIRVYDATDHLVAGTGGGGTAISAAALARVLHAGNMTVTEATEVGDRLRVVVPIRDDDGNGIVGAVVLSRSAAALDQRLRTLWLWIGLVAVTGLAAATVAAATLARGVSRSLNAPDRAAATMADVSHQLRTPLTALRLRLDLLTQDADPATAGELAAAQDEISRLARLADGLLAVARAENVVAEPVPVAVGAVIRDRATAWRPVAEERAVVLAQTCHGAVRAMAGAGHLEQILDNLLANALEAVPPGGRVEVSASAYDGRTRVVVADDGPGMSVAQQEQAFRRFASTAPGGAGLGLAIVHRLVTSNGGGAVLSDTPGGGLTVTIDLPAAPGPG
jgi:signal transduction histidine kinase